MAVYKCPVCEGRGFVRNDFYFWNYSSVVPSTSNTTERTTICRTCNGKGIVFETVEYAPKKHEISDEEARSWIGYCTYGDYLRSKGENNNGSDQNQ